MDYRPIIQRVLYIIESSLDDDIDLTQLSKQAYISVYHFCRLFVIYTGLSPMEYVRRRRMLHAASAIFSGKEILSIAVRYGYSSHSAFSRSFKKVFGCSPNLYRKIGNPRIQPCVNLYTKETSIGGKMSKAYETERLIIRNFQFDDWKEIQGLANNKESSKFAKYDHAWPTSDDGCKKMVEFLSGTDSYWAVCLKEDGRLIGFIAFNQIDENRTLDFGHLFHTDYMSEEFTIEALQRMVQYAFDELEIDHIVTYNAADWKGQIEPLHKLGMRKTGEGAASFSTNPDGTPIEFISHTLEITREEWGKKRK